MFVEFRIATKLVAKGLLDFNTTNTGLVEFSTTNERLVEFSTTIKALVEMSTGKEKGNHNLILTLTVPKRHTAS